MIKNSITQMDYFVDFTKMKISTTKEETYSNDIYIIKKEKSPNSFKLKEDTEKVTEPIIKIQVVLEEPEIPQQEVVEVKEEIVEPTVSLRDQLSSHTNIPKNVYVPLIEDLKSTK